VRGRTVRMRDGKVEEGGGLVAAGVSQTND
jgi:hypothetical protein